MRWRGEHTWQSSKAAAWLAGTLAAVGAVFAAPAPDFDGNSGDVGRAATLQSDGRILVGATLNNGRPRFGVIRYRTDGRRDGSFGGGDGMVAVPPGPAAVG